MLVFHTLCGADGRARDRFRSGGGLYAPGVGFEAMHIRIKYLRLATQFLNNFQHANSAERVYDPLDYSSYPERDLVCQGKLLALDLIVKVLESPQQHWDNIRAEFSEQLRQPLCLALLRNCISPYDEAYALATRLFTAIILQVTPHLRAVRAQ